MQLHRAILEPKFQTVLSILDEELLGRGVAAWTKPNGGYFVSVNVLSGCASKVVALCKEAGVALTNAGATYPYGKDPNDSNIRLAPTYPPVCELETAMQLFCICVKLRRWKSFWKKCKGKNPLSRHLRCKRPPEHPAAVAFDRFSKAAVR